MDRKSTFSLDGMEGTVLFSVFWASSYLAVLLGTGNAPHYYPLYWFGIRRRTLYNAVTLNLCTLNFVTQKNLILFLFITVWHWKVYTEGGR